ncbi:MAG: trypsin-like peptidase domain-containing protein [Actinomycetia bacterium]|nr:trypsin-like peptidase domain-containing protein [Actinomycetes bacterium]
MAIGVAMLSICFGVLVFAIPNIGSGSAIGPIESGQASEIAEGAAPAVVTVRADGCGVSTAGSGFVVDGMVVTNRHLVAGAEVIRIDGLGSSPGQTVMAGAAATNLDLAIIPVGGRVGGDSADGLDSQGLGTGGGVPVGLSLAETDPPVGAGVVMVGRGDGQQRWLAGQVHLYTTGEPYGGVGTVMLVDPAAAFGYSGGPVLDSNGRVVGILRALDRSTGLAIAIPVSELESWLYGDLDRDPSTSCIGAR